jgi:hypothetical protein
LPFSQIYILSGAAALEMVFSRFGKITYKKAHPNMTLGFNAQTGIEDTIRVQIASSVYPDIFVAGGFSIADYAKAGCVIDSTDYAQIIKVSVLYHFQVLMRCGAGSFRASHCRSPLNVALLRLVLAPNLASKIPHRFGRINVLHWH